jgi:hypothetical protein
MNSSSTHAGYRCKQCGGPSPAGVGYVDNSADAAAASTSLTACACGYSRLEQGAAGYGPDAPMTTNARRLAARGYTPPYSLAQSHAWAEESAQFARERAGRYVPTAPQHQQHARTAERFEAIAAQLQRLSDLDQAAGR